MNIPSAVLPIGHANSSRFLHPDLHKGNLRRRFLPKNFKNEGRSHDMYENKGLHDKMPEKEADICSVSARFLQKYPPLCTPTDVLSRRLVRIGEKFEGFSFRSGFIRGGGWRGGTEGRGGVAGAQGAKQAGAARSMQRPHSGEYPPYATPTITAEGFENGNEVGNKERSALGVALVKDV
jgi:hypothetical protein